MRNTYAIAALVAATLLMLGASNRAPDDPGRKVTFDVSVTDKSDNPVVGLERRNFRIFEDGVEQLVTGFAVNRKPAAVVILVEFSGTFEHFSADVIEPAAGLAKSLASSDWTAVVAFDVLPEIIVDFTHDKAEVIGGLGKLRMPPYRDAALYDAIYFVLDRTKYLDENGAIVLFGTGNDTMSNKRTLGDALKLAESSDTVIYTVGLTRSAHPVIASDFEPGRQIRLNDSENTLTAFAEASGGLTFAPQFPAQYRHIYEAVNADLHNRYTLSFVSTSKKPAGKLRRLRTEVVGTDIDVNGKPDKLRIRHKAGYLGAN